MDVYLAGLTEKRLTRALAAAFREIDRCEAALSVFRAGNDLARLGEARPGATVRVDRRLAAVLRAAAAISRVSGGVFDPRVRVATGAPEFADCLRTTVGGQVRVLAPLELDLGGIAKGYALDRAHAVLRRAGVPTFFLNAGGDLRLHGCASPLLLRPPVIGSGGYRVLGVLRAGASATSAQTFRVHLRKPARGGRAAASGCSFTVLAPSAMLADALTKVVALASPEEAARVLRRYRAHALVVAARGPRRWLPAAPPEELFISATNRMVPGTP